MDIKKIDKENFLSKEFLSKLNHFSVALVLFLVYYINMDTLMKKAQIFKLGKSPVVVLPVRAWELISERTEMLEEYYKMSNSKKYKKDIANARASKKEISADALYKKLGLI